MRTPAIQRSLDRKKMQLLRLEKRKTRFETDIVWLRIRTSKLELKMADLKHQVSVLEAL